MREGERGDKGIGGDAEERVRKDEEGAEKTGGEVESRKGGIRERNRGEKRIVGIGER